MSFLFGGQLSTDKIISQFSILCIFSLITNRTKTTMLGMTANKMGNKRYCTSLQKNKYD